LAIGRCAMLCRFHPDPEVGLTIPQSVLGRADEIIQ
jgi:hypothetical protein